MTSPMQLPALTLALCLSGAAAAGLDYPDTRQVDQKDDFHGTVVADPYRWLEQDVRESAEVADWVASQNALTFDYLGQLPARQAIAERLTTLWDFERYSTPERRGEYWFYLHNDGLQDQAVLYRSKTPGKNPQVVLDPNTWSDDGTVALGGFEVSPDGRYIAYGIQDGGSDWRTWRVKDLASGELLAEELKWIKFSGISWAADGTGFYYSRYPAPEEGAEFQGLNKNMAVYFHRVGTAQTADRRVHARPDHPEWGFNTSVSRDGRYLFIATWIGTDARYRLEFIDLEQAPGEVVVIEDEFRADFSFVAVADGLAYFRSSLDAPRGRVLGYDLRQAGEASWREVIPEREPVLQDVSLVGGHLVLEYLEDAHGKAEVFTLSGKRVREVALPGLGNVSGFPSDPGATGTYFSFSSLNRPATIYHYDVASGDMEAALAPELAFDPEDYVVEQVFYRSKDGTRVPMFIAHRKDLKLDGGNPTLLYGYGGFNISLTPRFSVTRLAWMDMGGVYAQANLRGGGEYGEAWHKAGTRQNKQNVFDDFIAAGEYLVAQKYTSPQHLGIYGGSNGGLLVGAVLNQRPDLFGAAIPAVGVMDMLRFHRFTAGRFWVDDYGSAEDPKEFEALYAYSPYHNIARGGDYPAVLVTTADTDDRVVPGHSFKYIARLQDYQDGEAPVLIRIQTRAGHGAGKPTAMVIEEYADMWAFMARHLGLKVGGPGGAVPGARQ
ncbi:prolyl oligopeptidase family serine peptidase [Parahaliea mediterranea]|uniref:prolyl oligopeptidase n=1 Tax=Parahaliea mediterranea TaxID=651086 RepID=A0A939DC79_9GAMM|nr:prolyl oligopeptidase family serine peptidase [Parahaliea mediterranea]MBN7795236.1 S9 family peptidase [Parahaliea mediterranea]